MAPILQALDREWSELATSPRARRALIRWANVNRDLAGHRDLAQVLVTRRDPARSEPVLRALASLAPDDDIAARTLLQAVVPGIVTLATRIGYDDEAAIDELVSLAWERIRTYPCERNGSVAANILLDVRKRYRRHRYIEVPDSLEFCGDPVDNQASTEDLVLGRLLVGELAEAQNAGLMSHQVLATILRTRLCGERLADLAAEQNVTPQLLCHRRWRADAPGSKSIAVTPDLWRADRAVSRRTRWRSLTRGEPRLPQACVRCQNLRRLGISDVRDAVSSGLASPDDGGHTAFGARRWPLSVRSRSSASARAVSSSA